MSNEANIPVLRAPIAGLLAWAVPGLGHIYLGERGRGVVLLITITITFWSGVAIGGVVNTVDPVGRRLWFTAQICNGGHTLAALMIRRAVVPPPQEDSVPAVVGHWVAADIGVHYTGVAGLLNLLVILDALARAGGDHAGWRDKRTIASGVP